MTDPKDKNEESKEDIDHLIDSIDTSDPKDMRPIYEGFTLDKDKSNSKKEK